MLIVAERNPTTLGLKRRLEDAGLEADLVADRKEAHHRSGQPGYRVIVLDLAWPRDDPFDALQRWRREGVRCHVLALAGGRGANQTVRALDQGADDVLPRPFAAEEFLARVRALARRSEPPAERVLRVHDLEIDRQSHVVRRGGRTIPLTPREFALLEVLARQPGRVVSRSAIWEQLYFDGSGPQTSNVVDVYVRYLRNKIDKGFDVPLILTRWGQGYLLRGEAGGRA